MALRRRGQDHSNINIWPGFVDAMTAMLLVFTFVLSIFMITQYYLRETILGQEEEIVDKDVALSSLTNRLDALSDLLSLEQDQRSEAERNAERLRTSFAALETEKDETDRRLVTLSNQLARTESERDTERSAALREAAERRALEALAETLRSDLQATEQALDETATALSEQERERAVEIAAAEALRKRLAGSQTELTAMELELDAQREKASETLLLLAASEQVQENLKSSLEVTEEVLNERETLLRLAQSELSVLEESTAEEAKQTALLNEQTRALREQLGAIDAQLKASEAERTTLEAAVEEGDAQIESLGSRLNTALAERNRVLEENRRILEEQVDELSRFRSEFFGKVRAALDGRDDILIVGDRFVFQSEVLFEPASADLNPEGEAELAKFAAILRDIASTIPEDVNWILRIDGHTDRRPLTEGRTRFRNNWELSQARALSVAEYLIRDERIAPQRLAPTGFGEFQPIRSGNTAEAYASNRRIELKLTER